MQGQRCVLRPFDLVPHTDALYRATCGPDTDHNWTYLPYGPFDDRTAYRQWMQEHACGSDPLFFTIIAEETDTPVGVGSYLRIDPDNGSIEVGHLNFSADLQRSAVATEAMYLMMKRVFDELGYRRYEWKCNALNARSVRAATRFGFTPEGIFRQSMVAKGRNRDTAWFSVTDKEWPGIRAAFEAWLDASNFDGDGIQHKPLSAFMPPR